MWRECGEYNFSKYRSGVHFASFTDLTSLFMSFVLIPEYILNLHKHEKRGKKSAECKIYHFFQWQTFMRAKEEYVTIRKTCTLAPENFLMTDLRFEDQAVCTLQSGDNSLFLVIIAFSIASNISDFTLHFFVPSKWKIILYPSFGNQYVSQTLDRRFSSAIACFYQFNETRHSCRKEQLWDIGGPLSDAFFTTTIRETSAKKKDDRQQFIQSVLSTLLFPAGA